MLTEKLAVALLVAVENNERDTNVKNGQLIQKVDLKMPSKKTSEHGTRVSANTTIGRYAKEAHLVKPNGITDVSSVLAFDYALRLGDVEAFLKELPLEPIFDLVVTSPPYNIGKEYETRVGLDKYVSWQEGIINELIPRLKKGGSLCWQVGNYVDDNQIFPLDIELAPIFKRNKLQLRNRIIWKFGHGLHTQRRFSGRYEVVLWYTNTSAKGEPYTFNLDRVRVPAKYPGKKHFKGPNAGQFSGNPLGKNPEDVWSFEEDVWSIPNVKSNRVEKTTRPSQFREAGIQRSELERANNRDLMFNKLTSSGNM